MIGRWWVLGLVACGGAQSEPRAKSDRGVQQEDAKFEVAAAPAPAPPAPTAGGQGGLLGAKPAAARPGAARPGAGTKGEADGGPGAVEEEEAATDVRDWFPEALLWAPEVVTGMDGRAVVPFTVPDSLTSWRLLAHGHTADGALGGAAASMISALPAWVDLVVPRWITAGDELQAGLLVVGLEPVRGTVVAQAEGVSTAGRALSVDLQAGERTLAPWDIQTTRPGLLQLRATLAGVDAVERQVRVVPAGLPVEATRGGVLTSQATWAPTQWAGRVSGGDALEVWVVPGGLGVLRQELTRLGDPSGAWQGSYGWLVAESLGRLATGVDPEAVRRLRMRAWQRLLRDVSDEAFVAVRLLIDLDGGAQADEVRPLLVDAVTRSQRGDGTWAFHGDSDLQLILLETAMAAVSLPPEQEVARLRAADAISRMFPRLEEPFSAAVALGSGLLDPAMEAAALARVKAALVEGADGTVTLKLPRGVHGADGQELGQPEALTWAAAALQGRDDEALRKVIASLVAGYRPGAGFGAGIVDGMALRRVVAAMPPVDRDVTVRLLVDGAEVGRTTLLASDPGAPGRIVAAVSGAEASLVVEPPMPGLGWSVIERARLPWEGVRLPAGVEVSIELPELAVGRSGTVRVSMVAPASSAGVLRVGLPAGAALSGPVDGGKQVGDVVELKVSPVGQGQVRRWELPVRPAFAGSFQSNPHELALRGQSTAWLAPSRWVVAGR